VCVFVYVCVCLCTCVCVCVCESHLVFDHQLVALHDELQLVPLAPQRGQRVQTSSSHGPQQAVLLLRTLELREDLHTHYIMYASVCVCVCVYIYMYTHFIL